MEDSEPALPSKIRPCWDTGLLFVWAGKLDPLEFQSLSFQERSSVGVYSEVPALEFLSENPGPNTSLPHWAATSLQCLTGAWLPCWSVPRGRPVAWVATPPSQPRVDHVCCFRSCWFKLREIWAQQMLSEYLGQLKVLGSREV